jgi:hypothetical protein
MAWIESPPPLVRLGTLVLLALAAVFGPVLSPLEREDVLEAVATLDAYWRGHVELPRWGLGILLASLLVSAAFIGRPLVERVRSLRKPNAETHHTYLIDTVEGVRWRWAWESWGVKVSSITPYCDSCDHELERRNERQFGGRTECWWYCPRCDKAASARLSDFQSMENRVKLEIERRGRLRNIGKAA